ncbi:amidohydrolase family protein [Thalassotalea litorea]|uniref:Amidohydrolase family protein n=1 Tax=Thalassotalea litorea TaxID=2020715 RepID=A0A5R9IJG1_9GAMM|nr:amidohydrolase family protein [Thalassotalea litorea]TLU65684.1 amidohydrolase family protein [Thalassotalea litorea]
MALFPLKKAFLLISMAFTSIFLASNLAYSATPPSDSTSSEEEPEPLILITNVNIFDGFSPTLIKGKSVLIQGNHIIKVDDDIDEEESKGAKVIDGEGRTLTPGLIDMHSHVTFMAPEGTNTFTYEWDFGAAGAMAAQSLRDDYLLKGITSARDIAGNSRGIANAIQIGALMGPRLYTSGGVLSHTGGHGDWGAKNDAEPNDYGALIQQSYIVDGREDVIRAARRNFRGGADFIKIMAGGGVASIFDPLEILGATKEELEAAVEISSDYGTYVAVHAYHDDSYNRALDAGVRSFEHGFLVSEETVERMADMIDDGDEIVWSFQCFMSVNTFGSYESMPDFFTHEQKLKGVAVGEGARKVAEMMKKHEVFTIGGADMFSSPYKGMIKEDITCNVDAGYTPAEALKHWTGNAGIVLKWSGPLDPYPTYEIGTIKENAFADILLWDGNPLEDIKLILDEDKLDLIMKDGVIYKQELK